MNEASNKTPNTIQILPEHIYQKIAAGEVIERPASVIRELMDNAIDAGADSVDVYCTKGGIEEIRVIDNGRGMTKDDLELSVLPHATSKVRDIEDLQRLRTLGFRGEALASIAASSKLEIISAVDTTGKANRIVVESGKIEKIGVCRGKKGTTIIVKDLFNCIPARKQFLKGASTEQKMCRRMFIEKAFPFTDIGFRFFTDGTQRFHVPPSNLVLRCGVLFSDHLEPHMLLQNKYTEDSGLEISCVLGYPEVFRKDRRYMYIYINSRHIDDYSFVQAVDHGYGDYLPGGRFPYAFIFLTVPPDSADFNIHPAKREVRLTNKQAIHRVLHQFVRATLLEHLRNSPEVISEKNPFSQEYDKKQYNFSHSAWAASERPSFPSGSPSFEEIRSTFRDAGTEGPLPKEIGKDSITYIGQLFTLFLLAAVGDSLYIIDQHAAHERYLFDTLNTTLPQKQNLLIPLSFETEDGDSEFIRMRLDFFHSLGIVLESEGDNRWLLKASPAIPGIGGEEIIEFIRSAEGSEEEIRKQLFASLACHSSVQDGDALDTATAVDLIHKALSLPVPRCPHGRPIWHTLSKERLFTILGRTV